MAMSKWSKEKIDECFNSYFVTHGRYPGQTDCDAHKWLPKWSTIRNIYKDSWGDFCDRYGIKTFSRRLMYSLADYDMLCERLIAISESLGSPPTTKMLAQYELPLAPWFIKHCPDTSVKTYSQFLVYLGQRPRFEMPKDVVIHEIKKMYLKKGSPLLATDFAIHKGSYVGIRQILKYWDTFTDMLTDLNLPMSRTPWVQTEEEMLRNIYRLAEEIGKTPTQIDIETCDYCESAKRYALVFGSLNAAIKMAGLEPNKIIKATRMSNDEIFSLYKTRFAESGGTISLPLAEKDVTLISTKTVRRRFACTWNEFVKKLGHIPNQSGWYAISSHASDGTLCLSTPELQIHEFLLSRGIEHTKEIHYRDILPKRLADQCGAMRCDWVVHHKDKIYIIEYFGLTSRSKYREKMERKINLVSDAGSQYVMVDLYLHNLLNLEESLFLLLAA